MVIHWHPSALDELNKAIYYVNDNFGSMVATKVLDEIEEAVKQLSLFPNLGKIEFQKEGIEYRVLHSKFNRIVYYVTSDSIEIVLFWNNRRDLKKLKQIVEN